jgi:hypothetical protein
VTETEIQNLKLKPTYSVAAKPNEEVEWFEVVNDQDQPISRIMRGGHGRRRWVFKSTEYFPSVFDTPEGALEGLKLLLLAGFQSGAKNRQETGTASNS